MRGKAGCHQRVLPAGIILPVDWTARQSAIKDLQLAQACLNRLSEYVYAVRGGARLLKKKKDN